MVCNRDSLQIMIWFYVGPTWSIVVLKMRFETWITWNVVKGISLYHLSYLISRMVYLCSQWAPTVQIKYFMFEWSIYRLFVTYRSWKTWLPPNNEIRTGLLDMGHNWTKNALYDVNNLKWRKWCNFISPFLYEKSYGLPVLTMGTNCPNQVIYVCLFDLQNISAKYQLDRWFSPNDDIRKCLLDMKNSWNKNVFWNMIDKKWRKWFLFNDTYGFVIYVCLDDRKTICAE
jgi:hypothetical protein